MKSRWAIAMAAGAVLLGGLAGWRGHRSALDDAFRDGLLLGRVAEIAAVVNHLELVERGDEDKLRRLLEHELTYALDQAADLTREGGRLEGIGVPYLAEGLNRAAAYVDARGLSPSLTRDVAAIRAGFEPFEP